MNLRLVDCLYVTEMIYLSKQMLDCSDHRSLLPFSFVFSEYFSTYPPLRTSSGSGYPGRFQTLKLTIQISFTLQ